MSIPGFTAKAALTRSKIAYAGKIARIGSPDLVVAQDCGFFKGLGCALGPISWCALSSFGGTDAFCNCVGRVSGGDCIDCTACGGSGRGLDPRAHDGNPPAADGAKGRFGLTEDGSVTIGPPEPLGQRVPDLNDLRRQLNRIERCACGNKNVADVPMSTVSRRAEYIELLAVIPLT